MATPLKKRVLGKKRQCKGGNELSLGYDDYVNMHTQINFLRIKWDLMDHS